MNVLIGVAIVVGIVIIAVIFSLMIPISKLLKAEKKEQIAPLAEQPKEEKRKIEFVKIIVFLVVFTYFIGVGFGVYAVKKILLDYPEYAIQALIALFGFIGTPITTAIGFYCWKAKAENIIKIKKEHPEETEGMSVDLNNIHV